MDKVSMEERIRAMRKQQMPEGYDIGPDGKVFETWKKDFEKEKIEEQKFQRKASLLEKIISTGDKLADTSMKSDVRSRFQKQYDILMREYEGMTGAGQPGQPNPQIAAIDDRLKRFPNMSPEDKARLQAAKQALMQSQGGGK